MSQLAQQVINPTVVDPDNVRETYVNGPFNLNVQGACATFTFTNVRPNLAQSFAGKPVTDHLAVVTVRLTVPVEMLGAMKHLLNSTVLEQQTALGPSTKQ